MTPLEKAKDILKQINARADESGLRLPSMQLAKLSPTPPVIACEELLVAITAITLPDETFEPDCNPARLATFVIILARACAQEADPQTGVDIPENVRTIHAGLDRDSDFLWDWAAEYDYYLSKTWDMAWGLEGGLAVSTLTLTTGID